MSVERVVILVVSLLLIYSKLFHSIALQYKNGFIYYAADDTQHFEIISKCVKEYNHLEVNPFLWKTVRYYQSQMGYFCFFTAFNPLTRHAVFFVWDIFNITFHKHYQSIKLIGSR